MEEQAVDITDCIAVEDTIENSGSEYSFWTFCDCCFTTIQSCIFYPGSINLHNSSRKSLESCTWETILWRHVILCGFVIGSSWLRTTKPKTEQSHFHKRPTKGDMSVVGPSGSGKTRLIFKMLASPTTFKPTLGKIYYFNKEYQHLFKEMQDKIEDIGFLPCLEFEMIINLENCSLVLDSCEEIYQKKHYDTYAAKVEFNHQV